MRLSRLFSVMLVVGVAAGATFIACGGNSTPKQVDAKIFHDAGIDSPGSGAAGIGKICTGGGSGSAGLCPTSDPQCITLNGTNYYCTEGCGYGPCGSGGTFGSSSCTNGSNQPVAPSGGNTTCMQQKPNTTATPACALFTDGPNAGSAVAWSCGLLCGTAGSANFGTCPTGLTCTSNFCM